ncbi:MAG TPA: magnesium transporter CorA family protein [Candidatus Saccharimonadales bacterium]|nr:magnesium transporter CorA family protein [Candidatus Saccharimonadales bacterium]
MVPPTPTSSSERPTGSLGEPTSRRRSPTSSGAPGRIRVTAVVDGRLQDAEGETAVAHLPALLAEPGASVWVDLASPSPDQVEAVGAVLGLHPLVMEDILEGNQRAKIEATDGVVHLVLFALVHGDSFVASEIDIVLGLGFLLTVHDGGWEPRASHHLRNGLTPILAKGPDHLLWAVSDDIVDGYFPFADALGEAIDSVQDEILRSPTPESLERLFTLKRELIEVRRAAGPTREVFNQLTNRDNALIDPEELLYFRDVYDHVIRLTDEMDNYRELASSTLDVYLTQVNNNLSVIMKRLTGVTVILAGVGAIAGIFGMSEAAAAIGGGEGWGFWLVTGVVVAMASGAAAVLHRIDWI